MFLPGRSLSRIAAYALFTAAGIQPVGAENSEMDIINTEMKMINELKDKIETYTHHVDEASKGLNEAIGQVRACSLRVLASGSNTPHEQEKIWPSPMKPIVLDSKDQFPDGSILVVNANSSIKRKQCKDCDPFGVFVSITVNGNLCNQSSDHASSNKGEVTAAAGATCVIRVSGKSIDLLVSDLASHEAPDFFNFAMHVSYFVLGPSASCNQ